MTITILNDCNFTEKHLAKLRSLGDVNIFNDTRSEDQAIERVKNTEIIVADCFFTPLNNKVISSGKNLKFIALNSTGFDLVDLKTASTQSIKVANVPNFATDAVAEHTIALAMAVNRKLTIGDHTFRNNPSDLDPFVDDVRRKYFGFNLRGKTMGIIGFGNIGQRVSELALGLGMNVVAYNRSKKAAKGVNFLPLQEVLQQSDIVSLNSALSDETKKIINEKNLKLMKPTAILINTARGGLIDTTALTDALKEKTIAGAGLDVVELSSKDDPILKLDNVVFSPHVAAMTHESFHENLPRIIVENIEAFIQGKPINIVN